MAAWHHAQLDARHELLRIRAKMIVDAETGLVRVDAHQYAHTVKKARAVDEAIAAHLGFPRAERPAMKIVGIAHAQEDIVCRAAHHDRRDMRLTCSHEANP